jgi:hypothetical protein
MLRRLREACGRAGRDFASLTISVRLGVGARKSSDELTTELRAVRDLGVHHVVLETRVRDLTDLTAMYERFMTDVRPRV